MYIMIFTESQIIGIKQEFRQLEKKLKKLGFSRWTWDLDMVIYDKKYHSNGIDYYLRIPGKVVNEKALEHPQAMVELESPIFARHFFPHGLDNDAEIPEDLSESVESKLAEVHKNLTKS